MQQQSVVAGRTHRTCQWVCEAPCWVHSCVVYFGCEALVGVCVCRCVYVEALDHPGATAPTFFLGASMLARVGGVGLAESSLQGVWVCRGSWGNHV